MFYIIKRNGDVTPFNKQKIIDAITKAFIAVDKNIFESDSINSIADEIEYRASHFPDGSVNVEDIQNWIEEALMASERPDIARAYIRYRYKKEVARTHSNEFIAAIGEKIRGVNIQNQNANVDEASFGGRMGEANSLLMKQYALDYIVSPRTKRNHEENMIYTHDLDHYAVGDHNCLSIPFDDLLANGFNTRQTDVRPAGSVNTAFQLVAVIFQLQSLQQFGGVSATHLDWTMVPYVKKSFKKHFKAYLTDVDDYSEGMALQIMADCEPIEISNKELQGQYGYQNAYNYALKQTEKEIHQAVEGMYHNLNTLQSRSGNQLPFTSINYGTCTLPEGRMITKALLEVSLEGLGKLHKTSIFPCGIFRCMKGVNREPGDPNYDLFKLALQSTAKRLYPNYANVDWSGNVGYDINDPRTYFSTMGCRTANGYDINGLGQLKDGRGNICPVTIILPTLAMMAKNETNNLLPYKMLEDNDETKLAEIQRRFMRLLDKKIHEAKEQLIERFEWICSQNPASAKFMYENNLMAGYIPEEGIRSALKHGTLAIGQLGLAETLQILIGTDHTTPKGMELAKKIESLFKRRCTEFKEQYKLNFGVYYTPAENLCYTAMKKFKAKYGVIPNVSDREFFTNSIHVPVWKEMTPFEKIDIESKLTGFSNAGCITYVELPSTTKYNLEALETIVLYAMDKDIPYFAVNVPVDVCQNCGYADELNDKCPMCGCTDIERLRRVTGYLTGNYTTAFNIGKQCETRDRTKHIRQIR